jgi:hypothetical protein
MKPRTAFRLVNILFWTAIWLGIVWWTEEFWHWVPMAAEAIIAAIPALFIHIALRTETPEI